MRMISGVLILLGIVNIYYLESVTEYKQGYLGTEMGIDD